MNILNKTAYTTVLASIAILTIPNCVHGQSVGSSNVENSKREIGGIRSTLGESLYIGPNAVIKIDSGAIWHVYSKNVWISPDATIAGPGTIVFHNPSEVNGTSSPTLIDGNNNTNYITANVQVLNASGVKLQNITKPSDLTGTDATTVSTLNLGANLDLAVNGAIVWLGGNISSDLNVGNLGFNASGAIISTGGSLGGQRMVVTNNSTLSHVIKDQSSAGTFLYPVGIASADYTPATIVGTGKENVSVIDYTQGGSNPVINVASKGMNRTWHVFGSTASSIILQHNSSTDGSAYSADINNSFITQYAGSGSWTYPGSANLTSNSGGVEVHTNTTPFPSTIPSSGTSNLSYLSKSVDRYYPLPVTYLYFNAEKEGKTSLLTWATATEINNKGFYVLRSADGSTWSNLGFVEASSLNGNSNSELDYKYIDESPINGLNYYKLQQVDLDGNSSESLIKTVRFDLGSDISIYPNPAYDVVNVSNVSAGSVIKIYTVDGKEVQSLTAKSTLEHINVNGIASGMYVIQVVNGSQLLKNYKFVKK